VHDGLSQEKLDAVWEFEWSDLFSEGERAALRLARDAALVPNASTPKHFEDLREHYSEDAIVQIVAVISAFGFLNRWNDTMATELEDSPLGFGERHLAGQGWSVDEHG
jgi:alkylhydroperoxidase family enzyme